MYDKESSPSHQPENRTAEQIPHSGVHHGEKPVTDFDRTPLYDAVERGLVSPTPDNPAGITTEPGKPEKPKRNKLLIGGAAGLAGVAVIAGSIMGIKAASEGAANTPPEKDPAESSQAPTPVESEEPVEEPGVERPVYAVEDLEIEAGLDDVAYAQAVVDRMAEWANAGAGDWLMDASIEVNQGWDEFLPGVAADNTDAFADALLADGWEQNEALVGFVDFREQRNLSTLHGYTETAWVSDTATGYERGYAVDAMRTITPKEGFDRTILINYVEQDNLDDVSKTDEAALADLQPEFKLDHYFNNVVTLSVSTVVENGVERIGEVEQIAVNEAYN